MIHSAIPATLLALASPAIASPATASPATTPRDVPPARPRLSGVEITQLSIHRQVIIRVPRMSRAPIPVLRPRVAWKEHKGPKCIAVAAIAGAMLNQEGAVDLLMDDTTRLRARLDGDCRPLDYYSGFYLKPGEDGMICKDRDAIRMRSGARCEIETFRTLRPRR